MKKLDDINFEDFEKACMPDGKDGVFILDEQHFDIGFISADNMQKAQKTYSVKPLFTNYTPQQLRDAISVELQSCDDIIQASANAIAKLKSDPAYYQGMAKARPTKYIKREPDGKGGWKYFYADKVKKKSNGGDDDGFKKTDKVIARPIKDVGLNYGSKLPDGVILHGSKKNNKQFEIDSTKTFYGTTNWEIASNYAKNEDSDIFTIKIKKGSNILDLNTKEGRDKLASIISQVNNESEEKMSEEFKNISLHVLGISDDVEYQNALYDANIDGIKDTDGNYDITNNDCLESYVPEIKQEKKHVTETIQKMNQKQAMFELSNIINANKNKYDSFGIRTLSSDQEYLKLGDTVPNSTVWYDNEYTDEELSGTSTTGIDSEDIDEGIFSALYYAGLYHNGKPYGYVGDLIALIGGDSSTYGQDEGESVISNGKIIALFKKHKNEDRTEWLTKFDPNSNDMTKANKIKEQSYIEPLNKATKGGFSTKAHKYVKRVPKPNGKGFLYYYADGTTSNHPVNLMEVFKSFLGIGTDDQARERIKSDYKENKISEKFGINLVSWADHLAEYFANKTKWDSKFSGGKKDAGDKKEKTANETPAEKKEAKERHDGGIKSPVMKAVYDIYGKPVAKPVEAKEPVIETVVEPVAPVIIGAQTESEDNFETMPEPEKTPAQVDVQTSKAINDATPENRLEKERIILGIPEPTEVIETPKVEFNPKDGEIASREWTRIISAFQKQFNPSYKVPVKDYMDLPPSSIYLVNEKTILTDKKPSYIPDVDDAAYASWQNFIPTVKLDEDKYLMQIDVPRKRYIRGEDNIGRPEPILESGNKFIVVNRDLAAAIQDYYIKKAKAVQKAKDAEKQKRYDDLYPGRGLKAKSTRISLLSENNMMGVQSDLCKSFATKDGDDIWKHYREVRSDLKQKTDDMIIQLEEHYNTHAKGQETSYGDKGTKDNLLSEYGVKVKRQNGADITDKEIKEVQSALDDVFSVFGNRSSMAKNFGLKISHSGNVNMHARKAAGLYLPSMKAIGVTAQYGDKGTGFILAHEWGHFMDNYLGKKANRHYVSDDPSHVAGLIASTFRNTMEKAQKSVYYNRTCECFARALEQYWAIKTDNKGVLEQWDSLGTHPSEDVFKMRVMPLIDLFFEENDVMLKAFTNEIMLDNFMNRTTLVKRLNPETGEFEYRRTK